MSSFRDGGQEPRAKRARITSASSLVSKNDTVERSTLPLAALATKVKLKKLADQWNHVGTCFDTGCYYGKYIGFSRELLQDMFLQDMTEILERGSASYRQSLGWDTRALAARQGFGHKFTNDLTHPEQQFFLAVAEQSYREIRPISTGAIDAFIRSTMQ